MAFWAIVPVKPLRRGKSRLSGVLSDAERYDLNRCMLDHTLITLTSLPEIEHVLVISRDPMALALARDHGARTVQENGSPHLNVALERATAVAKVYASQGVLIIPADLPLLTQEDIREMLKLGSNPPVVVVAPDHRRSGTNALLVCPAGLIKYHFGPNSFQKHCERAVQTGARLVIFEMPSLALDMDLPEDLEKASEVLESVDFKPAP